MTTGSAERMLAILDLFTEDRLEWTPEDLLAHLGYPRSTLYRYLRILREAGFLTSLPQAGFTLGPRVTELDFLMRKSDPLIRAGSPHLDTLADLYPCSAFLVRWYGRKLLCVASATSTPQPRSSYPRGRPMPLARGAISRAVIANLPRRQRTAMIAETLPDLPPGETVDSLEAALKDIRRTGVAIAHGEVTPGVTGVAAPIFDAGNTPIAALCLTSDEAQVARPNLDAIARDVRLTAQAISAALAGRHDLPAARSA